MREEDGGRERGRREGGRVRGREGWKRETVRWSREIKDVAGIYIPDPRLALLLAMLMALPVSGESRGLFSPLL